MKHSPSWEEHTMSLLRRMRRRTMDKSRLSARVKVHGSLSNTPSRRPHQDKESFRGGLRHLPLWRQSQLLRSYGLILIGLCQHQNPNPRRNRTRAEQIVARQPAISFSISFQHPFNRAGGRTSIVRQTNTVSSLAASKVNSLMSDISRLHNDIASISKDEARESDKIARASSSLSRATSSSSAQSYQRDIRRAQQELARLASKRASKSSDLARKQSDLASAQKSLMTEQQREMKKSQDIISSLERDARSKATQNLWTIRTGLRPVLIQPETPEVTYTAFVSHASEDKDEIARPLTEALLALGHKIWFDEFTIKIGDSLRRTIDRGLANSRFGIVILSPSFLSKNWPQYELDGMVAREVAGQKVILPIWHKLSKNEVLAYSPTLADKLALSTSNYTIDELAKAIHEVLAE